MCMHVMQEITYNNKITGISFKNKWKKIWMGYYRHSEIDNHCQLRRTTRILDLTWAACRVSCRKQRLLTLPEHLSLPPVFGGVHVVHLFLVFGVVSVLCLCFCLVLVVLRSLSVIVDFPLPWISHWYFFISLCLRAFYSLPYGMDFCPLLKAVRWPVDV